MKDTTGRRSFLKLAALGGLGALAAPSVLAEGDRKNVQSDAAGEAPPATGTYTGNHIDRIAFPIGGLGAGMFCLEGTGAISHMSVRNNPDIFNEPAMFAAICVKGVPNGAKVLEGPVPGWKKFGQHDAGLGGTGGATWGLPRMEEASFEARFPFATVALKDSALRLGVRVTGWNPFTPPDADHSSLPVAALEYTFTNTGNKTADCVFSYNSRNFMAQPDAKNNIGLMNNGFVLSSEGTEAAPEKQGDFAIFTREDAVVDACWFRGGWFDSLTMIWNTISAGKTPSNGPVPQDAPGASLFVPFALAPGQEKTIRVMMAWYVPKTNLTMGHLRPEDKATAGFHKPWYSSQFGHISEVTGSWRTECDDLRTKTKLFTDTFYNSTLSPEVIHAVAANLTILKSATVLRQYDGRFWCWEGSGDSWGSCHGSCTHVWNYAQAVSHLFPSLERSLRHTEFNENQGPDGHQMFRANLPITPAVHDFHAASDGQLGGIMKVYREWRISGDRDWLEEIYPKVQRSMDYCIVTWDPGHKGVVEEPHHNTYDIEFWGATGFATAFYAGALHALSLMGQALGKDVTNYTGLYAKAKDQLEHQLFNGEYFFQTIQWTGLQAKDPLKEQSFSTGYTPEALEILQKEGPKYQYGTGCLSDGILGAWIARMCGMEDLVDAAKIKSHLGAVYQYNFRKNLHDHSNPQRPTYALGDEGGLLLCSWPQGGKLSLPFVYSNEVWTGIEYQVASHLMLMGEVDKGMDIVKACRARYDGRVRNPFNEYECGHWYARAMSSYGLLQGLTGVRFDAVDGTLFIDSKVGDFTCFLSTATGFGSVGLHNGKPFLRAASGTIPVKRVMVSGSEMNLA